MSLEDLGNIGEFVAAVAVLISLIYLALQIRQNTAQMKQNTLAVANASYHQALEPGWLGNMEIARDSELAHIMRTGFRNTEELNEDERMRFLALMHNFMFFFEQAMRLHEHGLIDTDVWDNVLDTNERYFQHPGVQRYLHSRQGPLSKRLSDLLQERYGVFSNEDAAHKEGGRNRS